MESVQKNKKFKIIISNGPWFHPRPHAVTSSGWGDARDSLARETAHDRERTAGAGARRTVPAFPICHAVAGSSRPACGWPAGPDGRAIESGKSSARQKIWASIPKRCAWPGTTRTRSAATRLRSALSWKPCCGSMSMCSASLAWAGCWACAKMAADLDYVPLPDSLVAQVRNTWKTQIKGVPAT